MDSGDEIRGTPDGLAVGTMEGGSDGDSDNSEGL